MMWMDANLTRFEFRSRDDEWNQMNIVHVSITSFIIMLKCSCPQLIYNYVIYDLVSMLTVNFVYTLIYIYIYIYIYI